MYTAADIRNVEFTKTMGGYKAAEVDAFRDACADTVQALTAEKEELSKKLGILADKLVEYRRDEDSIRSALLSAQRMGDSVVRDAQQQAEAILNEARQQAETMLADAKKETEVYAADAKDTIAFYDSEMARMKKEISDFKANMLSLYKEHLALLKSIPDVRAEAPAPVEEAPAPVAAPAPAPVETPASAPAEASAPVETPAPAAPAEEEPVRKSRFTDLKFGEDYDMSEDDE